MLLHVSENCRDISKVMRSKPGSTLKLAHFTAHSCSAREMNKLLEPRVYTFSMLEEKLLLITALWKKPSASPLSPATAEATEAGDASGHLEFEALRLYADICEEVGCTAGKVYGKWHFGYQSKAYLCSFALAMKALHVCCKDSAEWGKAATLLPSGAALAKLPGYIVSPEEVAAKVRVAFA